MRKYERLKVIWFGMFLIERLKSAVCSIKKLKEYFYIFQWFISRNELAVKGGRKAIAPASLPLYCKRVEAKKI